MPNMPVSVDCSIFQAAGRTFSSWICSLQLQLTTLVRLIKRFGDVWMKSQNEKQEEDACLIGEILFCGFSVSTNVLTTHMDL